MGDTGIPVEGVDKVSKWTVFLLVDLKIVFIITFVYISVVNLISTTANNEASTDVNSNNTFTVTTEHTNVNVSFIDDAVLWNCRDHSQTKRYYQVLYSMLIGSFGFALVTFTIVKLNILFSAIHGHTYLWHIAIVQSIRKEIQVADQGQAKRKAKIYRKLLENECKVTIPTKYSCCRLFTLFINSFILPIGIFLAFTTYDLHPLSCISKGKELIEYTRAANATAGTVEIRFPDGMKAYRAVAVGSLFLLGYVFVICIICFYNSNFKITEEYEKEVVKQYMEIDRSLPRE